MCLDFYLHDKVIVYDMLVEMSYDNKFSLGDLLRQPSEEVQGDDREQKKEIENRETKPRGPT